MPATSLAARGTWYRPMRTPKEVVKPRKQAIVNRTRRYRRASLDQCAAGIFPINRPGDLEYARPRRSEEGAIVGGGSPNREAKRNSSLASPKLTMRSPSFRVVARGNVAIDAPADKTLQELKLLSDRHCDQLFLPVHRDLHDQALGLNATRSYGRPYNLDAQLVDVPARHVAADRFPGVASPRRTLRGPKGGVLCSLTALPGRRLTCQRRA